MYDFKSMSIFVMVVEQGSMLATAEKLQMTPSAVTQAIKKLESILKIKLLNRTTRKLSLTEAGEAFYQHAAQMVKNAESAVKSVEALRTDTAGELNITCVTGLIDSLLIKALKTIVDNNPDFHLNLFFEDRIADLMDQRIDIALRGGEGVLQDNMIARHIYDFEWAIVASPDYLHGRAYPTTPKEILEFDWVHFRHNQAMELTLAKSHETQVIKPQSRVVTNSLYSCRRLVINGFGVSVQPKLDIINELKNGELIQLLPDWQMPSTPLYLVTLQRIQSEKVRIVTKLITDYFAHLTIENS